MVGGDNAGTPAKKGDENPFESGGGGGDGDGDDPVCKIHLIAPPPTSAANCRCAGIGRCVAARRVDDGKYESSSSASRYEDFCCIGVLWMAAVEGTNESRSRASMYWGSCCGWGLLTEWVRLGRHAGEDVVEEESSIRRSIGVDGSGDEDGEVVEVVVVKTVF